MFDINDKEALIDNILNEIGIFNIRHKFYNQSMINTSLDDILSEIDYEVNQHTRNIIHCIIRHLYTHQEFEKDIGLDKV